jgi:hypothetical protein
MNQVYYFPQLERLVVGLLLERLLAALFRH